MKSESNCDKPMKITFLLKEEHINTDQNLLDIKLQDGIDWKDHCKNEFETFKSLPKMKEKFKKYSKFLNATKFSENLAISKLKFLRCMKENVSTNVLDAQRFTHELAIWMIISLSCMKVSVTTNVLDVKKLSD